MTELLAALVGAIVGGGLTAWATARTTRAQWDRERDELRRNRLDEAVTSLQHEAISTALTGYSQGDVAQEDWWRLLSTMSVVSGRSHFASPALCDVVDHCFNTLKRQGLIARKGKRIAVSKDMAKTLLTLSNGANIWLADSTGFEAKKPTMSDLWEGEYAKSFERTPGVTPIAGPDAIA